MSVPKTAIPLAIVHPNKPVSEMTAAERKAFAKELARVMRKNHAVADAALRSLPPKR